MQAIYLKEQKVNKHPTKIGETVCINKPSSPHHNKFGEYAGLADTAEGAPQKYRVDMGDGEIHVYLLEELIFI